MNSKGKDSGVQSDTWVDALDIEGEDIKVLNDLIPHTSYRPRYILIEASHDFSVKSLRDIPVCREVVQQYGVVGQTRANLLLRLGSV